MKPIKIDNEYGETIEIKWDGEGNIKIRHSDVHPKLWGELHEYAKRMRIPEFKAAMEAHGILDTPEAKEMAAKFGGYMLLRGKSYIINAQEIALIHAAIKKAGGIVPNWSSAT